MLSYLNKNAEKYNLYMLTIYLTLRIVKISIENRIKNKSFYSSLYHVYIMKEKIKTIPDHPIPYHERNGYFAFNVRGVNIHIFLN